MCVVVVWQNQKREKKQENGGILNYFKYLGCYIVLITWINDEGGILYFHDWCQKVGNGAVVASF